MTVRAHDARPLLALVLTLVVLPRAKGLLPSINWTTRTPGSKTD